MNDQTVFLLVASIFFLFLYVIEEMSVTFMKDQNMLIIFFEQVKISQFFLVVNLKFLKEFSLLSDDFPM